MPEANFPDIEDMLCDWAIAEIPGIGPDQVGSETPSDLQEHYPFIRFDVIGGLDDMITDRSSVDVDVFAATRQEAFDLAETVRQALLGYPLRVGSVVIDYVYTEQKPQQLPWDVETTRRFGATYRISARR